MDEVKERVVSTLTETEFFGTTKAEVFEALADWYSVREEDEFHGLTLHPAKKDGTRGFELRVKTKNFGF